MSYLIAVSYKGWLLTSLVVKKNVLVKQDINILLTLC